MAQPVHGGIEKLHPREYQPVGFPYAPMPDGQVTIEDMTGGMVVDVARDQLPRNSCKLLRNARLRLGDMVRRPGTSIYITKPDSNRVLKVVTYFTNQADRILVRVTTVGTHVAYTNDEWTAVTGGLTFANSRIDTATFLSRLVLTDGTNKPRMLNFDSLDMVELEEAPRARYVENFADRVFLAYTGQAVGGWFPTGIAWSANADPLVWDALDEDGEITGAGEENLAGSTDFGDPITGIFHLSNVLVILRERSLWHATRQPVQIAPVRFQQVISGVGCDLPYTAVRALQDSVIFASFTQRGVYFYSPGARPIRISKGKVESQLFEDLAEPMWCEGAWNPFDREYHLGLVLTDGSQLIERVWVWNFDNNAWSYDDRPVVSTLGVVHVPKSDTSIDDLVGTIDDLTGSIDDLGVFTERATAVVKGTDDGEVIEHGDFIQDYDAEPVELEWISHDLAPPGLRATLQKFMMWLYNDSSIIGSVTVEVSRDAEDWQKARATDLVIDTTLQRVINFSSFRGDRLYVRVLSADVQVRAVSWWFKLLRKGEHRAT